MTSVDAPARGRHTARWIAIAVGVVIAALVVVLATRKPAQSELPDNPLVGKAAPSFDASALTGERVQLASLKGRWVFVNFFNDWCVPCQQEHPELQKFNERHKAAGDAVLIGIIHGSDAGAVRSYLAKEGGDWPVIDDPRGALALDYGVRGQPETYVIDPNGFVVSRIPSRITADGLDRLLQQAKAAGA